MAITPGSFSQITKNISKIIAKTWLNDELGKQIESGLLSNNQDTIKATLRGGTDGQGTNGVALDDFFSEMTVYVFVDCSTFESGGINGTFEQTPNTGQVVKVNIPLPPRPSESSLNDITLSGWIDGSIEQDRVYSSNQYIARASSC
jgi:hypothetical protein